MNRTILFLVGCIGVRLFITNLARTGSVKTREYIAYLAIAIALGFLSIWLFDLRKTGFEAGGKIWWNNMRPVHALMYGGFAFTVLYTTYGPNAWMILFTDTLIGLATWMIHYGYI